LTVILVLKNYMNNIMPQIKKTKKIKKTPNLVVVKSKSKNTNLPTKTKQRIRETEKQKILKSWKQIGLSLGKIIDNS